MCEHARVPYEHSGQGGPRVSHEREAATGSSVSDATSESAVEPEAMGTAQRELRRSSGPLYSQRSRMEQHQALREDPGGGPISVTAPTTMSQLQQQLERSRGRFQRWQSSNLSVKA